VKKQAPALRPKFEVSASTEDNLWHLAEPSAKFSLCGKELDRSRYMDPTPLQRVLERMTNHDHTMCSDCQELGKVYRRRK